jgi:CBS domain-containing protein
MLVRELCTRDVAAVLDDAALDAAIRMLADRGVSALPVVDRGGEVVGIISEADVLRLQLASDPRAHLRPATSASTVPWPETVREVMTPDPVTAHEGTDVAEVAHLMADTGWKSVPVVDDHRLLVGMVSRSDVIRVLATSDEEIAHRVRKLLTDTDRTEVVVAVARGVVTVAGARTARDGRLVEALVSTCRGVRGVVVAAPASGVSSEQPDAFHAG